MALLFADATGAGDAAGPLHNLFFSIRPDAETAQRVHRLADELRRRYGMAGRPVGPERLHVSLNSLGAHRDLPSETIAQAAEAVSALRWPRFVVAFDRVGSWGRGGGPRAMVMRSDDGVAGVRRLHAAIHGALISAGVLRGREPELEPHMTLLRDRIGASWQFIAPLSWTVEELVLLDSRRGAGGHRVLGRWPMGCSSGAARDSGISRSEGDRPGL